MLKRKIMESKEDREARIQKWLKRPHSWSSHSSFTTYGKEDWYNKYIMGGESKPSKEMLFGSKVDKKIQEDPTFIPDLIRESNLQYKMNCKLNDFQLVGITDAICLEKKRLRDYKTGKGEWTHSRAHGTGQLTWYLLQVYLIHKIKPEEFECYIDWLPTTDTTDGEIDFRDNPVKPITFRTKRTLTEVLAFASEIIKVREEMVKFARNHS